MPKNKQGGKKHKKYAKQTDSFTRELILAEENQHYALVTKHFGNGRVNIKYIDPDKGGIEIIATIRGAFRKRKGANFVAVNNIVLISLREFETNKCDIIHVYKQEEISKLKQIGEINSHLVPEDGISIEEDFEFNDFTEEKGPQKEKIRGLGKNNLVKENYGIESDSDEEED